MQRTTKAAIALAVISPVLAELFSANSPASTFFNPLFLAVQLLSYGIPVLIIRELSLKWKLGFSGIFLLGLAYGIFNEGLLAATFLAQGRALLTFSTYARFGGVNYGWAVYVSVWHALHSILYPIALTYVLYPDVANTPWLSNRTFKIFAWIAVLGTFVTFLAPHKYPAGAFFAFWLAIVALIVTAKHLPGFIERRQISGGARWGILLAGASTILLSLALMDMPSLRAPFAVYICTFAVLLIAVVYFLKKRGWLSMPAFAVFAVGDYIAFGIFAMATGLPEVIAVNAVIIALLLWVARSAAL